MANIILETHCGDNFSTVAEKAKKMSKSSIYHNMKIQFDFNEVICIVVSGTNLEWLHRDYINASTMDWKTIGPYCLPEYEPKVQNELERRIKLAEEESERRLIASRAEEEKERNAFNEKVAGIEIDLKDAEGWKKSKDNNASGYGGAILEYAENWAKLMQAEIKAKGYEKVDYVVMVGIAERTSFELGFLGITGYMYGAAVNILSQCWKHGEALRKWHNKEYGHEGDGVVNPAIITLKG